MNLALRSNWRSLADFVFDMVDVTVAWSGAFLLRFNGEIPPEYLTLVWTGLLVLLPAQALIFRGAVLYRGIWVFASMPDLLRILRAAAISIFAIAVGVLLLAPYAALPRIVFVAYPLLLILIMG